MISRRTFLKFAIGTGTLLFPKSVLSIAVNLGYRFPVSQRVYNLEDLLRSKVDYSYLFDEKKHSVENEAEFLVNKLFPRVKKYWKTIQDLQNQLEIIDDFPYIVGAESDFISNSKSNTNVFGLVQAEQNTIKQLIENQKRDRRWLSIVSNIDLIDAYFYDSLKSFTLDDIYNLKIGFNEKELERYKEGYGVNKTFFERVCLPRYLMLKKLFTDEVLPKEVIKKSRENPYYNLEVGAGILFAYKMELNGLSVAQKDDESNYLYYTKHGSNVFNDIAIWAAYSKFGIGGVKNLAENVGSEINGNWLNYIPEEETHKHNRRIQLYKKRFELFREFNEFV